MRFADSDSDDESTYEFVVKCEKYYVEFLPENVTAKLPVLFAEQHADEVSWLVMLCDPVGNEFQPIVKKVDGYPYFGTGWNEMGLRYCLHGAGMIRLVYVRKDRFFINVKNRFGEVEYPTPRRIFTLGRHPVPNEHVNSDLGDRFLRSLSRVPTLYHTLCKQLTADGVRSGQLSIPAYFCEDLLPLGVSQVKLVDSFGYGWACELKNDQQNPSACGLYNGWALFCHAKMLCEGVYVKIGVAAEKPSIILLEYERPAYLS